MSPPCHQEVRKRFGGQVVDLEWARVARLAGEIAWQLRVNGGSILRLAADVDEVDRWRRAARRAGRVFGWTVRTGVSSDRMKVWASEGP